MERGIILVYMKQVNQNYSASTLIEMDLRKIMIFRASKILIVNNMYQFALQGLLKNNPRSMKRGMRFANS